MKFLLLFAVCVMAAWETPEKIKFTLPDNKGDYEPAYVECMKTCPSTSQLDPVCGTDKLTYYNIGRLSCAQACGRGLSILTVYGYPDSRNPNSEYELINPKNPEPPKPLVVPLTTQRNIIINTPPPPPPDSKTFAYNPVSKTWTKVKENDPPPLDDTLLWNQSNDKWLTMVSGY